MHVSFVHCTPNAENLIVDMARVSNPANQGNYKTAPKLIAYLIKHKHWSPFEMASMCVKIETERDIAAQILRHRSFSFQEFSTRYAQTVPAELPALRRQDNTNRQNSFDDLDPVVKHSWDLTIGKHMAEAYVLYQQMLDEGIAKETARRILPLCTPTALYMHGTLRSWIHYLELRCAVDTQLEHRLVADAIKTIFVYNFPSIAAVCFD